MPKLNLDSITKVFKRNSSNKDSPPSGLRMDLPYVTDALELMRKVFTDPMNKYQTYMQLVDRDPELLGAITTKAVFISRTLDGFALVSGTETTENEKALQKEMNRFHRKTKKYYFDIAFKVLRDGNACYIKHFGSTGLVKLEYLPMYALTCQDNTEQENTQITKRGVYILTGLDNDKPYKSGKVLHFDLGLQQVVIDVKGRTTINVWNKSPLESLRAKLLWKTAIILNDMIWRERHVPREHHQLPADQFLPENFPGKTPGERMQAATTAAINAIKKYRAQITASQEKRWPRPDQGYITLDNVKIDMVESNLKPTDPNPLLKQIDKSISSVYVPESTVSGASRSSFATESAIGMYTTLKSEVIAEAIANVLIDALKEHLGKVKGKWSIDDYDKIIPRFNKSLERHTLVRDAAILLETGSFTPTEVRQLTGFEPLTENQKDEIVEYRAFLQTARRAHTESLREVTTTSKREEKPNAPVTPHSGSGQQLT